MLPEERKVQIQKYIKMYYKRNRRYPTYELVRSIYGGSRRDIAAIKRDTETEDRTNVERYLRVKNYLRMHKEVQGYYPTYAQIAKQEHVSRTTIRKIMKELEEE
jgi:hypothetical protein